jgi:hypothetical protein
MVIIRQVKSRDFLTRLDSEQMALVAQTTAIRLVTRNSSVSENGQPQADRSLTQPSLTEGYASGVYNQQLRRIPSKPDLTRSSVQPFPATENTDYPSASAGCWSSGCSFNLLADRTVDGCHHMRLLRYIHVGKKLLLLNLTDQSIPKSTLPSMTAQENPHLTSFQKVPRYLELIGHGKQHFDQQRRCNVVFRFRPK